MITQISRTVNKTYKICRRSILEMGLKRSSLNRWCSERVITSSANKTSSYCGGTSGAPFFLRQGSGNGLSLSFFHRLCPPKCWTDCAHISDIYYIDFSFSLNKLNRFLKIVQLCLVLRNWTYKSQPNLKRISSQTILFPGWISW